MKPVNYTSASGKTYTILFEENKALIHRHSVQIAYIVVKRGATSLFGDVNQAKELEEIKNYLITSEILTEFYKEVVL